MKNIILIIAILAGFNHINAQDSALDSFYAKYKGGEDVTSFNLGGSFLKSLTINDEDADEFHSILKQLNILSLPYSSVSSSDLRSLKNGITRGQYEELIQYRSGQEKVGVYIKEGQNIITHLLILVENPDESLTLVTLTGEMSYEDLNKLNLDGSAGDAVRELPNRRGK